MLNYLIIMELCSLCTLTSQEEHKYSAYRFTVKLYIDSLTCNDTTKLPQNTLSGSHIIIIHYT